jgi:hypothetical protein
MRDRGGGTGVRPAAITPDEVTVTDSEWKAAEMGPGSENRRYPRLECVGIAYIRLIPNGIKEPGSVVNLSKRGCCFRANKPLCGSAGSTVEVHLKVNGINLRFAGVIRHVHKGARAGIEFVIWSERKCRQIDELIAELTEMDKRVGRGRQKVHKQQNVSPVDSVHEQPMVTPVHSRLLRFYRD